MTSTIIGHDTARKRVRRVIEKMYGDASVPPVGRAQREAILKGVESALRDYERSFPHRPRPL